MGLKYKYAGKQEIPAEHQALYVEREGAFVLDAEGVVEKAKLDEFRQTNVALLKERDELKQRFEGIDPAEVRKLAEEKRRLEEQQQLKAGEVEKVVETRVKAARGELEKQVAALSSERDTLSSRLTGIQIDQAVVTEATKRGLRATAIPNAGGGAAGNGSGGVGSGARPNGSLRNPFRRDTWNLTEQMKLQKSDPALAARLKAAA
jgi:hypothetical protein